MGQEVIEAGCRWGKISGGGGHGAEGSGVGQEVGHQKSSFGQNYTFQAISDNLMWTVSCKKSTLSVVKIPVVLRPVI